MAGSSTARRWTLTFAGAAGTVTGSKFLVRDASRAVLVDCGMFQGLRELRRRNWTAPPFDVEAIDAVILSHAHLDHCGYLPRLIRDGFHGRVIATEATAELAGIVLPDSGHLQEEEAEYANRRGTSRHDPAEPLYTEAEGRRAAAAIETVRFGDDVELAPGLVARLSRAGHILGSSIVALDLDGERRIGFSGDLGRPSHPLLVSPDPVPDAEVLLVESTYGNRRHADTAALDAFADAIERTIARGGSVLIPAFAVDRTEVILFHLARLADAGRLPAGVPVYVDSPMALSAMRVYRRAIERRDPDVQIDGGHDPFRVPGLVEVHDVEASIALNHPDRPSIVISASGMATGGRVVHHLAAMLPEAKHTVVLVGFQAAGTRGRSLAEGARELKMLGRYVRVRAEVLDLPAFSVHADADELMSWVAGSAGARREPEAVYVVHGEPTASAALAARIGDELDWLAVVPRLGERVRL